MVAVVAFWVARNKLFSHKEVTVVNNANPQNRSTLKLESSAFSNGGDIPSQYTCDGTNVSPPLKISGVPQSAQSLVLILHDPDAPLAGGFLHWTIWNIDPGAAEIPENSVPAEAVTGNNGSGQPGYTGPCPPSGQHHYNFYLYALDAKLDLPLSATKTDIEQAMQGHILEQTILGGLYKR